MAYVPIIIAFGMMALAIPVPVCLLAGTFVYFQFINPSMPLTGIIQNLITQSMSTSMLAPPFYIAAACVMTYSGISERLLDMCDCLLGHKKGGLAYVNVLLSTLNGGMSGSANADAAMQCKMLVPEMEKKGYPKAFCCVVTAASSLITPIIPPGVPLILYAMMAGVSIGRMWVSGYIPGFMLCIAMMSVCYIYAHKYNWSSGRTERASGAEIARSIWRSSLAMIIPLFMIFGLRSGAFTATEGGTVLLILAIVIGICYRKLHISHIFPIIKESFVTTANVMLIVVSACGFSMYLSWEQIPQKLAKIMMGISSSSAVFLILVVVLVFILGMFLDGTAILMILTPLLAPVATSYGIDLIVFGMIVLVVMYIGCLTPPFGTLMYMTCKLTNVSIPQFCRYSWAFILAMLAVCVVMGFFPDLVTFLPNLVYG